MAFELPKLPYAQDALEPFISNRTIEFHYGKHHQTYVNNLNNLVIGTRFEGATIETMIREGDGGIFNNAAQVWNHTFYFESFAPQAPREPVGNLAGAITGTFGSWDAFREKFTQMSVGLFGSGWAWLVKRSDGTLEIIQEPNAGNPLTKNLTPLLTCDVWEHAYYLDYQNKRPDYLKAFWNVLDWNKISSRY
jgi:Fe-Mn family superoxide dismutase